MLPKVSRSIVSAKSQINWKKISSHLLSQCNYWQEDISEVFMKIISERSGDINREINDLSGLTSCHSDLLFIDY